MIVDEIKKIKSGTKELREFGITFAVAFALIGGVIWWRHHAIHLNLFLLSLLFVFFSLTYPAIFLPFQKAWMTLALLMGWVMSRVILGILFFLTVTPIALFLRLTGKHFMALEPDNQAASYWHLRPEVPFDKTSCEKQY
ncbi:MAG: SxtJ family membrane protein [Candidatus Omnitrophota bacterium]|jgi:hypothetical protein